MKKFVRNIAAIMVSLFMLVGCGGGGNEQQPSDQTPSGGEDTTPAGQVDTEKPYFVGVPANATCVKGETYDALQGVQAFDAVDGEITSKIVVTTDPVEQVNNGKFVPSQTGYYEIVYSVTDAAGNEAKTFTELNVTKALSEKTLVHNYDFGVGLNGWEAWAHDDVVGTHGIVDGVYRFNITSSTGTDWHIKYALYNAEVEGNHNYEVEVVLRSNVAGTVKLLGNAKAITAGENTIKASRSFSVSQNTHFEIQFGELTGPFVVDIVSIKITDSYSVIESATPMIQQRPAYTENELNNWTFNGDEWHCEFSCGDGCVGNITKAADHADVAITTAGDACWKGKFILQTKQDLEPNTSYKVSADFTSSVSFSGAEFGYGSWDDDFKHYVQQYNIEFVANETKTLTGTFTSDAAGGLIANPYLCLKMGNMPVGTMRATNFKLQKVNGTEDYDAIDYKFTVWSENAGNFEEVSHAANKVVAKVNTTHASTYLGSINALVENIYLKVGKNYEVSMKVTSTKDIEGAELFGGKDVWDPQELFKSGENIRFKANEPRVLKAYGSPSVAIDTFKLRLKCGKAPVDAEITLEDLAIKEVSFPAAEDQNILPNTWTFNSDEWTCHMDNGSEGFASTTDKNDEHAVFTVSATTTDKGWSAKLIIESRVALVTGHKYRISADLELSAEYNGFEIGVGNWDDDFKAGGARYGVNQAAGKQNYSFEFVSDGRQNTTYWGLCFKVGTAPVGEVLTVSNFKLVEIPAVTESTSKEFRFAPDGLYCFNDGDSGSSGKLYVEENELVYDITSLGHTKDWDNKFYVSDILLEAGKVYTMELVVKSSVNLSASLLLNVSNKWDVRASKQVNLTTEYQTIELVLEPLAADMSFELLLQGFDQNSTVDSARLTFQSIKLYSQVYVD